MSGWRGKVAAALLLFATALAPAPAWPHEIGDQVLAQVGVDEQLGRRLPTELTFRDQTGKEVQLSRYFTGAPVILTLNYYSCPMLCPLIFRNLAGTIGGMRKLTLGKDFRVVTVSIDPQEAPARAADSSAKTYAMLPQLPDPGAAWPFLLGSQPAIERLAQGAGVRYSRVGKEFAHPNVIIIATPDGRIARYLYGIELAPQDLKLALIEASGGSIGGTRLLNRALLYCFHYDPAGRKYVLIASRIMTGAMLAVLFMTLGLLALLWKRERKPQT